MRHPVVVVVGTRPEWIKSAPVVAALSSVPVEIVATGQQADLLETIPGAVTLGLASDGDPEAYVERVRTALRTRWMAARPACVVVQGDTASAYGAALAASQLSIPVAHVEAGVRSGHQQHPWPEEYYRQEIDRVSRWLFAVTPAHAERLAEEDEDFPRDDPDAEIVTVGNTVADALRGLGYDRPLADRQERVVVTLHRREGQFAGIVEGLLLHATLHPAVEYWWPMHPNGRAAAALTGRMVPPNVFRVPPLARDLFVHLLARSKAVLTDSGGVQEEAALLGVDAVIARHVTDRPETVEAGRAVVAGFEPLDIYAGLDWALQQPVCTAPFLDYGTGSTAIQIAETLTRWYHATYAATTGIA